MPLSPEGAAALQDKRWGRHRQVEANGVSFHLVENGESGRRPLLLLMHGFPESW